MSTLYWHDYETSGVDPRRDRAMQFAGLRTDENLQEIGDPLVIYCKPSNDLLPQPEACLLTGITPQKAAAEGLLEVDFIDRIHTELAQPGTCGVGYNTLRFDDEVTRNTLYRNFYDPYAREWQHGNSRWDLIDLVRMTYALRPQGIEWPQHEDGRPSFRLEQLTAANGIGHQAAHDALSDVRATIGLARLLKQRKGRLYDWLWQLRDKRRALELLDLSGRVPVLHSTRMYPSQTGCTSLVMPLLQQTSNKNSVLVYDLRHDPEPFIGMSAEQLRERLFTRSADLPEGETRLPVKSVKVNKCPALAPLKVLDEAGFERIELDLGQCRRHWKTLQGEEAFIERIGAAFDGHAYPPAADVEAALYDGFLNDRDRDQLARVRSATPQQLAAGGIGFKDPRLPELLFRYRARNWPQSLSEQELTRWREYRDKRLQDPDGGGSITLEMYGEILARLRDERADDEDAQQILDALEEWGGMLAEF